MLTFRKEAETEANRNHFRNEIEMVIASLSFNLAVGN